ncbi:transcription factor TFIID [Prochlorococcus marinus str. MU1404]|nr:transcription factor TFIID [Prochlorococcus marinus str. MU1404]
MMKTAFKSDLKSKTFSINEGCIHLKEKEISLFNSKFYQKIFVLLTVFSTFLIFPETPKELENICESYNSKKTCNVW